MGRRVLALAIACLMTIAVVTIPGCRGGQPAAPLKLDTTRLFDYQVSASSRVVGNALPSWRSGRFNTYTLNMTGGSPPYVWQYVTAGGVITPTLLTSGITFGNNGLVQGTAEVLPPSTTYRKLFVTAVVTDSSRPALKVEIPLTLDIIDNGAALIPAPIAIPVIPAPVIATPVIPAPVIPAPVEPTPVTPTPITPTPVTPTPPTPEPAPTPEPSPAPGLTGTWKGTGIYYILNLATGQRTTVTVEKTFKIKQTGNMVTAELSDRVINVEGGPWLADESYRLVGAVSGTTLNMESIGTAVYTDRWKFTFTTDQMSGGFQTETPGSGLAQVWSDPKAFNLVRQAE